MIGKFSPKLFGAHPQNGFLRQRTRPHRLRFPSDALARDSLPAINYVMDRGNTLSRPLLELQLEREQLEPIPRPCLDP